MSLLDYAPRTPPEQDAEVHLKMYLSGRSFLAMIAATGLVLLLLAAYYLVVVDPNWHPKHVRGKGAWFVLLMFLLPVIVRSASDLPEGTLNHLAAVARWHFT